MSGYTAGRRNALARLGADMDLLLWLHAEERWKRRQLGAELFRLQDRADEMGAKIERLQSVSLIRRAAVQAWAHGNQPRAEWLATAADDHEIGQCGNSEEGCFAERTARKALAEYGVEVAE